VSDERIDRTRLSYPHDEIGRGDETALDVPFFAWGLEEALKSQNTVQRETGEHSHAADKGVVLLMGHIHCKR